MRDPITEKTTEFAKVEPQAVQNALEANPVAWNISDSILWWVEYVPTVQWAQDALVMLHNAGLPWWAAIVSSAVCVRALMMPLIYVTTKNASIASLHPETRVFTGVMNQQGITPEQRIRLRMSLEKFLKEKGFRKWKNYLPLVSIPISMSFAFAIGLLAADDPSFHTGGALWFVDLADKDFWMRLAYINGLSTFLTHEVGVFARKVLLRDANAGKSILRYIISLLSLLTIPLMGALPQGMLLFWSTGSVVNFLITITNIARTAMKSNKKQKQDKLKGPGMVASLVKNEDGTFGVKMKPATGNIKRKDDFHV